MVDNSFTATQDVFARLCRVEKNNRLQIITHGHPASVEIKISGTGPFAEARKLNQILAPVKL